MTANKKGKHAHAQHRQHQKGAPSPSGPVHSDKDPHHSAADENFAVTKQDVPHWSWRRPFRGIKVTDIVMTVATAVIAFSTWRYTHYAGQQWETMQRQLTDYERRESAQLVIEDFTPTVTTSSGNITFTGSIRTKNVGASIAKEIFVQYAAVLIPAFPFSEKWDATPSRSGQSLGPGDESREIGNFDLGTDKNMILNRSMVWSINIAVSYRNIFGVPMVVSDCLAYVAKAQLFRPCRSRP